MAIQTDKIIFYHIPKTGGIYTKEAIRRSGIPYGRAREIKNSFWLKREHSIPDNIQPRDKDGRLSFCFVRNPISWYKSFWCYRKQTNILEMKFHADRCWDDVFERFVVNMLEQFPNGFVTELYKLYVGEDLSKVDMIGTQENLTNDLVKFLYAAGEDFDEDILRGMRKFNVSHGKRKYSQYCSMSKPTINWLLDTEKWITETFYV